MKMTLISTVIGVMALVVAASTHAYGHGNVISAKPNGKYSGLVTVTWQLDSPQMYGADAYRVVYLWIGPPTTWLPLEGLPHVGHSYRITRGPARATNSFTTPNIYRSGSYAVSILVNETFHSDTYYKYCAGDPAGRGPWVCSFNDWSYPAAFRIPRRH
jgi:hypothetical protein